MRLQKKHLFYAAGLAVAGFLTVRALQPEVLAVDAAAASIGPLEQTVGDQGETRARHRHVVTAPVAGRVERIALEVGDVVGAGTVVARLAPLPLDPRSREQAMAALAAARDMERVAAAAVGRARAARDQARADRVRGDRLLAGGGIAPAEAERLSLAELAQLEELKAAESRHRAATHDVEAAQSALQPDDGVGGRALALTCPIGGQVLALPEQSARAVAPGEPLLVVGDPHDLEIIVDVLSTDAVKVSPGDRMRITGWGGEGVLTARVTRVDPAGFTKVSALGVEEQRVSVMGRFDSLPPRLGDRYRVDARIVLWSADRVLRVPSSALFRRGEQWAVFVVDGGRARERAIRAGHESGTESEVLEGLALGDLVIRHPTDRIRDGTRVRAATR